jgi:phosphoribosylamine---glycine ligase
VKFLFRSSDNFCLAQCVRVQAEGNKVKLSTDMPGFDEMGDGLIEKSVSFDRDVDWADCVVYDVQAGPLPAEADKIRRKKPTIGASELGGELEHNREFGIDFARQGGMKVPEVETFKGVGAFRKAREYLQSKPRETVWVFKVNKKAPEGVGTYVSKDGRAEMLRMLEYYESRYHSEGMAANFILCRKIDGVEVSTEAWFNGSDFFLPNHTIERTKFFPGDLGEKVGCTGNVVWALPEAPLYQKLLSPLRGALAGKFVGPLDVNTIIEKDSREPVFLEYSPRFGYDAIFGLMELFESDFGQFLYEIATGQTPKPKLFEGFAGDVRITIPPYPAKGRSEKGAEGAGVPIFNYDARKFVRWIHPMEVMLDKEDRTVTSGPHGCVLAVSGRGADPSQAQDAAYGRIGGKSGVYMPNMRYRNDLTDTIAGIYNDLVGTGWLKDQPKPARVLGWPGMGGKARATLSVQKRW